MNRLSSCFFYNALLGFGFDTPRSTPNLIGRPCAENMRIQNLSFSPITQCDETLLAEQGAIEASAA
jgi:hypothetical protein